MVQLASDPKWKERVWQTRYEPKESYIQHLLMDVNDSKKMIDQYDKLAVKYPNLLEELVEQIELERQILVEHQDELKKVVSDV